jgi:pimeloyl-ACP methyl ester carboxylesterase
MESVAGAGLATWSLSSAAGCADHLARGGANIGAAPPANEMKETVIAEGIGRVDVSFSERGAGQPVLLLHGGGGPASVTAWANLLAAKTGARVVTPTHPGLIGTPRPEALTSVGGLARVYAALIDKLGLEGASVMGHSIGGWIAAELGLLAGGRISSLVLVDAVGIDVPDHPAEDVFGGTPATPEARVLKMYAGTMMDPSLRPRLSASALPPTLVVWGDDDGVVDRDYGRAYAHAISGSEFRLLRAVGHSPQIEAPELLADTVRPFLAKHARLLRQPSSAT